MATKARFIEYFVVCGLGPDLQTTENQRGFHGTQNLKYQPALLDQFPSSTDSDIPSPPPQLPLCVLPGGIEFYSSGPNPSDESSHPRSYPIVLTDGDGSKIYVCCVAFRDPVDDDVAQAYRIPANSYVDKCICVVSHSPSFKVFREGLEELHRLCFATSGASKPLWDIVAHMVLGVPLPGPGRQVLFAVENFLLNVEAPPTDGLPHADMSFQPLVQCLDIDNVIRLFTAVLLERRVLLRASKYSVLTMIAEALCQLIYPIKWQHVYIPVLFYGGVEYIDAPTPYLMGLHSSVDTSGLQMDGVVDVDLDNNKIITSADEPIPAVPEPELGRLRNDLLQLIYSNLAYLDRARTSYNAVHDAYVRRFSKPWCSQHDRELRIIFLKFFATILYGYRDFVDYSLPEKVFNSQAFLKKRSRMTSRDTEHMVAEFISSQGFIEFLERGYGCATAGPNLVDRIQEAMGRGQDPSICFPEPHGQPEILTVSDTTTIQAPATRARYCYDRFPSIVRTPAQEEKRKAVLAAVNNTVERPSRSVPTAIPTPGRGAAQQSKLESLNPEERAAERERMVLDIKVKLQGLWRRLLMLGRTDDPLGSFEFGTIYALIESDAEGFGGSGFVECIREHISTGWQCKLSDEQFIAVKELIKITVSRATSRNDMGTVRDSLEISFQVHKKDMAGISDYIQRHLGTLPVWNEPRFWDGYFEVILERAEQQTGSNFQNYASLVTEQLIALAQHMAGLGLPDSEAWSILETLAQKNNLGSKQLIKLRGILAHLELLSHRYWRSTHTPSKAAAPVLVAQAKVEDHVETVAPSSETAGIGRSWVQSMFSRDRALQAGRSRNGRDPMGGSSEASKSAPQSNADAGHKKNPATMRVLRGHKGAITALHTGAREGGELVDMDDTGFFLSGSADCTIKLWDPNSRTNSENCRATFNGHTGPIRAIGSDRSRVVTGSDDHTVLVWDKNAGVLQEELKGHEARVNCVRILSGERVITAGYDGTARMWDVRTDQIVSTLARHPTAILCLDFEESSEVLAVAGVDGEITIWDVRAGKKMHQLIGHTSWIRALKMGRDVILSGSDDWTARMWSVSRGTCDSVLSCHKGAVTSVELCKDEGVITGSADGMVRLWEREDGTLRSVKTVTGLHAAPILSIRAGDKWLAVGAADNSMSLFSRVRNRSGVESWQLYRTPQRTAATIRCAASDAERGRVISGARNNLLRVWEPVNSV
ncbi:hypothetical protein R1flu_008579 [Riccia fluitans]|uniref:UDENN domain-containing protein n=1 Tax=Riccia fluitans TaxID=41844 RepID=A0ABD1YFN5_9MARC